MTTPVGSIELVTDSERWNTLLDEHGGHPLQGWGWGELKATFGWTAHRVAVSDGGTLLGLAQVLVRRLPFPFRALCYVPRGPVLTPAAAGNWDAVLTPLTQWCRTEFHPVFVRIEPPVTEWSQPTGFRPTTEHVLLGKTAVIDLERSEDEILADFHSKTRQYIRKSEREGVSVDLVVDAADLDAVLAIYGSTADRADFLLHSDAYYRTAFAVFGDAGRLFVARFEGEIVSFLWLIVSRGTAFELWGGMSQLGERRRSNYTLKAKAILACKDAGVRLYDLNGLLGDGISKFKRTFVQSDTDWVGTFDRPMNVLYPVWVSVFPTAVKVIKALGR